jgi:hypothetical protein
MAAKNTIDKKRKEIVTLGMLIHRRDHHHWDSGKTTSIRLVLRKQVLILVVISTAVPLRVIKPKMK